MTLPNDEFDTIGGLVMKAFGRLPRRGESIELGRCWFRVLTATIGYSFIGMSSGERIKFISAC